MGGCHSAVADSNGQLTKVGPEDAATTIAAENGVAAKRLSTSVDSKHRGSLLSIKISATTNATGSSSTDSMCLQPPSSATQIPQSPQSAIMQRKLSSPTIGPRVINLVAGNAPSVAPMSPQSQKRARPSTPKPGMQPDTLALPSSAAVEVNANQPQLATRSRPPPRGRTHRSASLPESVLKEQFAQLDAANGRKKSVDGTASIKRITWDDTVQGGAAATAAGSVPRPAALQLSSSQPAPSVSAELDGNEAKSPTSPKLPTSPNGSTIPNWMASGRRNSLSIRALNAFMANADGPSAASDGLATMPVRHRRFSSTDAALAQQADWTSAAVSSLRASSAALKGFPSTLPSLGSIFDDYAQRDKMKFAQIVSLASDLIDSFIQQYRQQVVEQLRAKNLEATPAKVDEQLAIDLPYVLGNGVHKDKKKWVDIAAGKMWKLLDFNREGHVSRTKFITRFMYACQEVLNAKQLKHREGLAQSKGPCLVM